MYKLFIVIFYYNLRKCTHVIVRVCNWFLCWDCLTNSYCRKTVKEKERERAHAKRKKEEISVG